MAVKFESQLMQFAFIPKYNDIITDLVEKLADKEEQWYFSGNKDGKYPIMHNYLEHYFRKVKSENKIAFTKEEVKRRVKTNYKIAIPQFFNNQIQLLLPLCLTPNSQNPDLALVIHRINNTYRANTCLTLKMAYNNARLIVKPQSSWLKP